MRLVYLFSQNRKMKEIIIFGFRISRLSFFINARTYMTYSTNKISYDPIGSCTVIQNTATSTIISIEFNLT